MFFFSLILIDFALFDSLALLAAAGWIGGGGKTWNVASALARPTP